jgi:uncharacterized membrane protein YoaK (UPF0700 family)
LRDLLLAALTAVAGATDALSYLGLGQVFTANMTGNLVLLGVGAGRGGGAEVGRSAAAFVAFAVGVVLATRLVARREAEELWPREVTLALCAVLVAELAFLVGWELADAHPTGIGRLALIAASGLAMGGQSAGVRSLEVSGISTTYVTGTLTALLGELAALASPGVSALRRAGVLVGLVAGAVGEALLLIHARRLAPLLPLSLLAMAIAAAWWLGRSRR